MKDFLNQPKVKEIISQALQETKPQSATETAEVIVPRLLRAAAEGSILIPQNPVMLVLFLAIFLKLLPKFRRIGETQKSAPPPGAATEPVALLSGDQRIKRIKGA